MSRVNVCKVQAGDLGCYDGPPIRECYLGERFIENARSGSERLLTALQRTGLRP